MRYNAGDVLRVKSLEWFKENRKYDSYFCDFRVNCGKFYFHADMTPFLGKVITIRSVGSGYYNGVEDNCRFYWTDEMFEELSKPTIEESLIQLIKDNSNLDYREFCLLIESYLDSLIPCNYESEYIKESCNIDGDILLKKILELKEECQGLSFSHTLEKFVQTLSKREIAYLMLIKYYPAESDCAV